jgi:hypothetical protein
LKAESACLGGTGGPFGWTCTWLFANPGVAVGSVGEPREDARESIVRRGRGRGVYGVGAVPLGWSTRSEDAEEAGWKGVKEEEEEDEEESG